MGQVPFTHDVRAKTPELIPGTQRFDEGAFGANAARGLGAGLEKLGQGLSQAGDDIYRIQQRQWALDNETEANNALMQFSGSLEKLRTGSPDDPDDAGFLGLKGLAAVKAYPQMMSQMRTLQQQGMNNLANPAQREMFGRESHVLMRQQAGVFGTHALQQKAVYQQESTEATIEQAHNYAVANYTDLLAVQQGLVKSVATLDTHLRAQGLTPDNPVYQQAQQDNRDAFFTKLVRAQAGNNDATGAFYILVANRKHMSPLAFARAQAVLKPHIQDENAEGLANQAMGLDGESPVIAPASASKNDAFKSMVRVGRGQSNTDKTGGQDIPPAGGDGPVGVARIRPDAAREIAALHGISFDEKRLHEDQAYNWALGKAYYDQVYETYGKNPQLAAIDYWLGSTMLDQWRQKLGDPLKGEISLADWITRIPDKDTRDKINLLGADMGGKARSPVRMPDKPSDTQENNLSASSEVSQAGSPGDRPQVAGQSASQTGLGNAEKYYNNFRKVSAGYDRGTRNQAAANISCRIIQNNAQLAKEEWDMDQRVADMEENYMNGNAVQEVPEEKIRKVYAHDKAEQVIHNLYIYRESAPLLLSAKSASPEDIGHIRHMIEDSDGQLALDNKKRGYPQGTILAKSGESIEDYNHRMEVADCFKKIIEARNDKLKKDPQAYVLALPEMQGILKNAPSSEDGQTEDPRMEDDYNAKSLAEQKRLGVKYPRLLTNDETVQMVQQWKDLDISRQDPIEIIGQWERKYGRYWPRVAGELQRYGKLDVGFQILINADTPAQSGFRHDYVAAMRLTPRQLEEISRLQGKRLEVTSYSDIIGQQLAPFRDTIIYQAGGPDLYAKICPEVKRMAQYYLATPGVKKAEEAAQKAVDGMLNEKYDFDDTIRAPKGSMKAVKEVGSYWIKNVITVHDIGEESQPGEKPQRKIGQSAEETLKDIKKSGKLVMNHDESGYNIILPTNIDKGEFRVVYGKDGKPLTLSMQKIRHPDFVRSIVGDDIYDVQGNNIVSLRKAVKAAQNAKENNPPAYELIMEKRYQKDKF